MCMQKIVEAIFDGTKADLSRHFALVSRGFRSRQGWGEGRRRCTWAAMAESFVESGRSGGEAGGER